MGRGPYSVTSPAAPPCSPHRHLSVGPCGLPPGPALCLTLHNGWVGSSAPGPHHACACKCQHPPPGPSPLLSSPHTQARPAPWEPQPQRAAQTELAFLSPKPAPPPVSSSLPIGGPTTHPLAQARDSGVCPHISVLCIPHPATELSLRNVVDICPLPASFLISSALMEVTRRPHLGNPCRLLLSLLSLWPFPFTVVRGQIAEGIRAKQPGRLELRPGAGRASRVSSWDTVVDARPRSLGRTERLPAEA